MAALAGTLAAAPLSAALGIGEYMGAPVVRGSWTCRKGATDHRAATSVDFPSDICWLSLPLITLFVFVLLAYVAIRYPQSGQSGTVAHHP